MKTKAEKRNLAILGVLLAIAALTIYFNVYSGDSDSAPPRAALPAPVNAVPERVEPLPDTRRAARGNVSGGSTEIKPRQGPARPEDRRDPATIDPTLRLDLLAKVQNVEPEVAMRNLFQYGAAPPPTAPAGPPIPLPKNVPKIPIAAAPPATAPKPPPPGPPPAPQAPPITMKYYGYKISKEDGRKEAFLLDGDDIIIASENEALKKGRYRVVSIGVNSITIEDTQFKSTQVVRIQEEAATA